MSSENRAREIETGKGDEMGFLGFAQRLTPEPPPATDRIRAVLDSRSKGDAPAPQWALDVLPRVADASAKVDEFRRRMEELTEEVPINPGVLLGVAVAYRAEFFLHLALVYYEANLESEQMPPQMENYLAQVEHIVWRGDD